MTGHEKRSIYFTKMVHEVNRLVRKKHIQSDDKTLNIVFLVSRINHYLAFILALEDR